MSVVYTFGLEAQKRIGLHFIYKFIVDVEMDIPNETGLAKLIAECMSFLLLPLEVLFWSRGGQ